MTGHVRPLLDQPASEPGLGFDRYASTLANMIRFAHPPNMTIGIFGGYGSGKTTLMRAIEKQLTRGDEKIVSVWFNAWRYDHEEHLVLPFLAAVSRKLAQSGAPMGASTLADKLKAAASGILYGLSFKVSAGFLSVGYSAEKAQDKEREELQDPFTQAVSNYFDQIAHLESLSEVLKEAGFRVAVFVDDLDRCVPEKAFALIESLKSLLDVEGFLFILGLDTRTMGKYVEGKYAKLGISTQEYLEKVFQLSFDLPSPETTAVLNEILSVLEKAREVDRASKPENGDWQRWAEFVQEELRRIGQFLPNNLRKVKRLLNAHQAAVFSSGRGASLDRAEWTPLLYATVLEARWPQAPELIGRLGTEAYRVVRDARAAAAPPDEAADELQAVPPARRAIARALLADPLLLTFVLDYLRLGNSGNRDIAILGAHHWLLNQEIPPSEGGSP